MSTHTHTHTFKLTFPNHREKLFTGYIPPNSLKQPRLCLLQTTCCGGRPYNSSQKRHRLCCSDHLVKSSNSTETKCCGKHSYNPHSETCCEGRVNNGGKRKCCGKNVHGSSTDICCGNKYIFKRRRALGKCCGDVIYDTSKQFCVRNSIVRSRKLSPCGFHFYDNSTQLCCGGEMFSKGESDDCCSKKKYNREYSLCCDNQVYSRSFFICCDNKPYRIDDNQKRETWKCCEGKMSKARRTKCGKKKFKFREFKKALCSSRLGKNSHFVFGISYCIVSSK